MTPRPAASRTGKQCRDRWVNHLDPAVRKVRAAPPAGGGSPLAQAYDTMRLEITGPRSGILQDMSGKRQSFVRGEFQKTPNASYMYRSAWWPHNHDAKSERACTARVANPR
jgi:hypothetical protein